MAFRRWRTRLTVETQRPLPLSEQRAVAWAPTAPRDALQSAAGCGDCRVMVKIALRALCQPMTREPGLAWMAPSDWL